MSTQDIPPSADWRAELQRLVQAYDDHGGKWPDEDVEALYNAFTRARTALAQPEPEGPTVMEIIALADEIEEEGLGQIDLVRRALARWGRPAIQPVPVADPEAARQWPAHWSRAQREREAQSLCLQAGIDPVQQKRLCRDARDGMPLQDIHDLIAAEPDSRPSQEDYK